MPGFTIALLYGAVAASPLDALPQTRLDADRRCLLGVYALPAGQFVTITGAGGQPRALHYTLSNGRFGALNEGADGAYSGGALTIRFAPCRVGTLTLNHGGVAKRGVRLRLVERRVAFVSDGVRLHGKLVLPSGGRAQSAAVWIEGSNNDPSTDDSVWQYELARRGVAVFVYDKRGTGASAGEPTSDFHARARDTVAAVQAARQLAPGLRRVGVIGASQGGWVAPLAATKVRLNFIVAAFALAEGPIAQDRALVEQQLRQAGFADPVLLLGRQLTAITERIVRSGMGDGFAELEAFKSRYAAAPWLASIQPRSYTGLFLKFSTAEIRTNGPALAQGLTFDFEPRPLIEAIKADQLWLLGGRDQQAPSTTTQSVLRDIQKTRQTLDVVIFPDADHGLIERTATGEGTTTRYSARLFDIAADWIKHSKRPAAATFVTMPRAKKRAAPDVRRGPSL